MSAPAEVERGPAGRGGVDLVLASAREWLASSLRTVLEPEGYRIRRSSTLPEASAACREAGSDILILDRDLVEPGIPDRFLDVASREALSELEALGTPTLLYCPEASPLGRAAPSSAGRLEPTRGLVWDTIEEPVRSRVLVEKLSRLTRLRDLIGASSAAAGEGGAGLDRLLDIYPLIASIGAREGSEIGCAVLGPTWPPSTPVHERRREMAALLDGQTRATDLRIWLGGSDVAVVLYGADLEGVGAFVARVARTAEASGGSRALSAGLTALRPVDEGDGGTGAVRADASERVAVLARVESAREALERARRAGGGLRVATG